MRNWFRANRWAGKQKSVHDLSLFSLRYWSSTDFTLNGLNELLQVNFIFKNNFQCALNGFPFPDLKVEIKTQIIHFALRGHSNLTCQILSFWLPESCHHELQISLFGGLRNELLNRCRNWLYITLGSSHINFKESFKSKVADIDFSISISSYYYVPSAIW